MTDPEYRASDKRRRKLSKHYSVLINGEKIKILKYRFKPYQDQFESGELIELVSKIKIPHLYDEVEIEIETDDEKIHIKGKMKYAVSAPGNWQQAFLIIEKSGEPGHGPYRENAG